MVDFQTISYYTTQFDDAWTADERADNVGVDLIGIHNSKVVLYLVGFSMMIPAAIAVAAVGSDDDPAPIINVFLIFAGIILGAVSVYGAALVVFGTKLSMTPFMTHQAVVAVIRTAFIVGVVLVFGLVLSRADALLLVLGIALFQFLQPGSEHQSIAAFLRKPPTRLRSYAMFAAQRHELRSFGLSDRTTVLGSSLKSVVIALVSDSLSTLAVLLLVLEAPAAGVIASLTWIGAQLADLHRLTKNRSGVFSVVFAVISVAACALVVVAT